MNGGAKPAEPDGAARCIRSEDLLGRGRRVYILHDDRRYALTLTRKNRLILTLDVPAGEVEAPQQPDVSGPDGAQKESGS